MLIVLSIVGAYLLGLLVFHFLNVWFRWTDDMSDDDEGPFIGFWPFTMWWLILTSIESGIKSAREKHDQRVEDEQETRVATEEQRQIAEEELQQAFQSLEEDLNAEQSSQKTTR